MLSYFFFFFFSSRRRHTRCSRDWSSDVCSSDLAVNQINAKRGIRGRKLELRVVDDSGNEDTAVRVAEQLYADPAIVAVVGDRKSTRLNSSHGYISYAVFCLKKKKKTRDTDMDN